MNLVKKKSRNLQKKVNPIQKMMSMRVVEVLQLLVILIKHFFWIFINIQQNMISYLFFCLCVL